MMLFECNQTHPLTGRIVRVLPDRVVPLTDEEAIEYLKFSLHLFGRKQINDVIIEYRDEPYPIITGDNMNQQVLFIRHDVENEVYVNIVDIIGDVPDLKRAIRNAAAEYLATPEGKRYVIGECGCYNFGDAMMIPTAITVKHGYIVHDMPDCDYEVHVDQNESLLPDDI